MGIVNAQDLRGSVDRAMARAKITDIHTHLYAPCFGDMLAWGIDELLTYHYLIAEGFRQFDLGYDDFWALSAIARLRSGPFSGEPSAGRPSRRPFRYVSNSAAGSGFAYK